jgi:CubicO group peptidase (beta-lactamase class C family)
MRRIARILSMMLIVSACAGRDETAAPLIADAGLLDATLTGFVEDKRVAGASLLVFHDGAEVYFGARGDADPEADTAFDRNTLFQIYSMSKPITGVALMTLYEAGAFKLDDPLSNYLPEFSNMKVIAGVDENGDYVLEASKRPITIRDITRHTAGFVSGNSDKEYVRRLSAELNVYDFEQPLAKLSEKLGAAPLAFHPGEEWLYGPSVDVQAALVEKLSGVGFADYLQERIFSPLGMNETSFYLPPEKLNRIARRYNVSASGDLSRVPDEEALGANTREWALTPGGWGLVSTIDDYSKFARMLLNDGEFNGVRILDAETVKLMATNHLPDSVTRRSWLPSKGQVGFGVDFAVRTAPPASDTEFYGNVGEFFWDGFASTKFWVDPHNDLVVIFLTQKTPFDGALHKELRDAVYGVPERGRNSAIN